ncbi:MAG: LVIVD repeat-containing protein [Gemmatimonadaceae bacterium]
MVKLATSLIHTLACTALAAAPALAQDAPSSVARIVVTPAVRQVTVGDTVRFSAQALDAAGNQVRGARIMFSQRSGEGGELDTTGVLVTGSTGVIAAAAVAIIPGQRPKGEPFEVRILPGPATRIEFESLPSKLVVGQRVLLTPRSYSAQNDERQQEQFEYESSAPRIVRAADGVLTALAAGRAMLTVTAGETSRAITIQVVPNNIASMVVTPNRARARQGDLVRFAVTARTRTGATVTGLTPHWSLAGGEGVMERDGGFVGYAAGRYTISASLGSRTADAVITLEDRDVRRAVSVVGRLPRTAFTTAEVWLHPNGKVAYLGTHGGGDRFYTIDISEPSKPTVVDSVMMNTRLVNDIMTDAAGKILVATREGAADRKNGIVIFTLDDPLRPKVASEFTEGVTAGVHSAFIYTQPRHGTHVYLTNDGTGAVHVVDVNDPAKPQQLALWKTPRADAGRYLHDVEVQDGLLYGSWWNDGLVILDVGNGVKGGSPGNPVFVSQFKYDLDAMYREVEIVSGPGHARGTHTAWRHKNYVFIADEVYRAADVKGAKDESATRMYGNLQVIDVSDLTRPKAVAYYKPENGGVHNVWVAGDTLYMGVYDGGFRAFDISGELRGDLRAQNREIAALSTADMNGNIKNVAQTWGVVVKNDLAYVNDFNNGLWIIRIEPRARVVP